MEWIMGDGDDDVDMKCSRSLFLSVYDNRQNEQKTRYFSSNSSSAITRRRKKGRHQSASNKKIDDPAPPNHHTYTKRKIDEMFAR